MTLRQAIAKWYLRNASIRHGHLPDEALELAADAAGGKLWPLAAAAVLGAGGALAGSWLTGSAGSAGSAADGGSEAPPFVSADVEADVEAGSGAAAGGTASLYQWLEDRDLHLPAAGGGEAGP